MNVKTIQLYIISYYATNNCVTIFEIRLAGKAKNFRIIIRITCTKPETAAV
jgi:hypothetical protein